MYRIEKTFREETRNLCAKRIRAERGKRRGQHGVLTQSELAEIICRQGCPMSRITVSRIESGAREITDYELIHFAYALDVDVRYLLCGRKTVSEIIFEYRGREAEEECAAGA